MRLQLVLKLLDHGHKADVLHVVENSERSINWYVGGDKKHDESSVGLSWSTKAAAEAEYVASISCSGHGRAYLDGSIYEGQPVCECYDCYVGANCAELSPGCAADANRAEHMDRLIGTDRKTGPNRIERISVQSLARDFRPIRSSVRSVWFYQKPEDYAV
nr:putative pyridoxal phosphate-dependent transferase [Tanacetum cinerariifolium]